MLHVTPSDNHPLPANTAEQVAPTLQENARIAANTANIMFELGMPFEMTADDEEEARKLFAEVDKKKLKAAKRKTLPSQTHLRCIKET